MGLLQEIEFRGAIKNSVWKSIGGPEFFKALARCGWYEGTGTHFFQQLRKDGPTRGINTPGDLVRAIERGRSEPGPDGKTIHWMHGNSGSAIIVYNASTRTLITFTQA